MACRVDKWLWAVRVFKTRTVATDACKKGRVTIGGTPAKPAREVKPGDVIEVRKPPITYAFKVLALAQNRMGAKLVPQYMENVTDRAQLDLLEMSRLSGFVDRRKGLGRPTKRESRDMSRFISLMSGEDFPDFDSLDDDDFDDDTDDFSDAAED